MSGQQADFVVVANRLPVDLENGPTAATNWKRSPGGLVTALEPMLRSRQARGSAGPASPTPTPSRSRTTACSCTRSSCSADEVEDYYEGFSNGTLWPLYHDVVAPPSTTGTGGAPTCGSTSGSPRRPPRSPPQGATVWVQDYQLQLVPAHAARAAART